MRSYTRHQTEVSDMKRTEQDYLQSVFRTFIFPLTQQVFIDISGLCPTWGLKQFARLPPHATEQFHCTNDIFSAEIKKLKFDRLAYSGNKLYDVDSNVAYCENIRDLCSFFKFLSHFIFRYLINVEALNNNMLTAF